MVSDCLGSGTALQAAFSGITAGGNVDGPDDWIGLKVGSIDPVSGSNDLVHRFGGPVHRVEPGGYGPEGRMHYSKGSGSARYLRD
jgi:hypothetical protein